MAKVLLGVTGSIAAYRSPDVVKALLEAGHEVRVVLTQAGSAFVTSKTLETFSGEKVIPNNVWDENRLGTDHIESARWADVILVYGTTANFIAKVAGGFCDDFLTLQIVAANIPIILAPAMNVEMWNNPATTTNIEILKSRKINFVGPIEGKLACGEIGLGHVAPVDEVVASVEKVLAVRPKRHENILISLGGMRTQIDPVRFIQNSSSGRMGIELAKGFLHQGCNVTVLVGLIDADVEKELAQLVQNHKELAIARFVNVSDYELELKKHYPTCTHFFSVAAVLDFDVLPESKKLSFKSADRLDLKTTPTSDYVAWAGSAKNNFPKFGNKTVVAFALETGTWEHALSAGRSKLKGKCVDAIVVNRAGIRGEGPHSQTNSVRVITHASEYAFEGLEKGDLSERLVSLCLDGKFGSLSDEAPKPRISLV